MTTGVQRGPTRGGGAGELAGFVVLVLVVLGLEALVDIVAFPLDPISIPIEAVVDILLFSGFVLTSGAPRGDSGRRLGTPRGRR